MNAASRSRLDLEALADAGESLAGRFDAAVLDSRLAEALAMKQVEGEVRYELDFARLPNRTIAMSGHLDARLMACCQRCLKPFELILNLSPRLVIAVPDQSAAPEPGWEVAEAGAPPSLAALVEEELLLALPFSPRHSDGECPLGRSTAPVSKADTRRPFSGLADALAARNRGRG